MHGVCLCHEDIKVRYIDFFLSLSFYYVKFLVLQEVHLLSYQARIRWHPNPLYLYWWQQERAISIIPLVIS